MQELLTTKALAVNPTAQLANCLDHRSYTPLHAAIDSDQLELVRMVLEKVVSGSQQKLGWQAHCTEPGPLLRILEKQLMICSWDVKYFHARTMFL